jgi:hypothetical protein
MIGVAFVGVTQAGIVINEIHYNSRPNDATSQYVHGLKIAPRFLLKQAHTTKYRPLLHPRIGESLPLRPESNLEAEIIVLTVLRFA